MGIETRIETARFLINNHKHEDALIVVLIAVASSARKQYPLSVEKEDGRAFKRFLSRRMNEILTEGHDTRESFGGEIEFFSRTQSGKHKFVQSIEELVYEQYRCSFVHEGELPREVQFVAESPTEGFMEQTTLQVKTADYSNVTITIMPGNNLVLNYAWLYLLIAVVEGAEINADIYGDKPKFIDDGQERIFGISIKSH